MRSLLISACKSNYILQFFISYTKPFALTYIYVKLSGITDISIESSGVGIRPHKIPTRSYTN